MFIYISEIFQKQCSVRFEIRIKIILSACSLHSLSTTINLILHTGSPYTVHRTSSIISSSMNEYVLYYNTTITTVKLNSSFSHLLQASKVSRLGLGIAVEQQAMRRHRRVNWIDNFGCYPNISHDLSGQMTLTRANIFHIFKT